jgi:3-deoxy-D-manno-octulosonic-acid transferase
MDGFLQRFGVYETKIKQAITNRDIIWFHAVSVGEVNICTQLIRALEPKLPNIKIIVSTTTTTGMGELNKKLPSHITKIYYPIDRRKYVTRALSTMHPKAIILVEAEIWPNFIWRAQERGSPLFLVNARLSDRSYRGYKRFGRLFKPLFASFTGVGAQTEADAAKLRELGFRPEAINIVGSLKFDAAKIHERRVVHVDKLMKQVGAPDNAQLLVAGSTHIGEEALLAELFLRLKTKFPNLFLVIVPRHFERSRDVGRDLTAKGLNFFYRSEIGTQTLLRPGEVDCLLVNTTGELKYFYEDAAVVFVGKSLTANGGQNPIEPAAMGKPVVFGPNMQNFADAVRGLLATDGAVQVRDAVELEKVIGELLASPARCAQLGENAQKYVQGNLGAIDRTVEMIVKTISAKG